jgi:hypothetical protein
MIGIIVGSVLGIITLGGATFLLFKFKLKTLDEHNAPQEEVTKKEEISAELENREITELEVAKKEEFPLSLRTKK